MGKDRFRKAALPASRKAILQEKGEIIMGRSSKVLAVTLALAMGLSAMPFGALADQVTSPAEEAVTEEWTGEDSTEDQATNETAAPEGEVPEEEVPAESGEPAAETPAPQPATPEAAMALMLEAAPLAETVLTVGDSATYATLADAVTAANDSLEQTITIELKSDLTVNECARIDGKDIILNGNGYTITRGEDFEQIQDTNRSTYNPAIIEVTVAKGTNASLTLNNVTLDDAGQYEGTVFAQAVSEGNLPSDGSWNNTRFVQDAMIAVYGTASHTATVTMGAGATLKNFGGMSAVRLTEGAYLKMESGSAILDDTEITRDKGTEKDSLGPAGAVWVQGTNSETEVFTMQDGAQIGKLNGRAVYMDGGKAQISGYIHDITGNTKIWQDKNGTAVHIRNNANVVMGGTGKIEKIESSYAAVSLQTGKAAFTMEAGAQIVDVATTAISAQGTGVEISDQRPENDNINLNINGKVTGITNGNVVNLNNSDGIHCTIGSEAVFENNTLSNGAIYMQGKDVTVDFYGKITNNVCPNGPGAVWVANNYKGGSHFTMYEGAEISNNVSSVNECGTINVSMGTFLMKGGVISGNIVAATQSGASAQAAPIWVRRNGVFIMEGGSITGNYTNNKTSGAVLFDANIHSTTTETLPKVELKGGTITGNMMSAAITQDPDTQKYTAAGGEEMNVAVSTLVEGNTEKSYANINRYMQISESVDLGNTGIYLEKYDITLNRPAKDVKFGNASDASVAGLKAQATNQGWGDMLATLWVHGDSGEVGLEMSQPAGMKESLPVYAVVLPADEEGNPVADAEAVFCGVAKENGKLQIKVPGDNANGYVLGLVQPGVDYGSMTLTVPEKLDRKSSVKDIYQVPGTAVYTMSSNLRTLLQAQKPDNMTLTVEVDPKLSIDVSKVTLTSDVLEASDIKYENGGLTLTCTLKEGWEKAADMTATLNWTGTLVSWEFTEGDVLETTGAFRATVPSEPDPIEVYVPAMAAVTKMSNDVIVTAADITVYMGGEHGYEGVVSDGAIVGSNSLPEPGFYISVPEGWIENWLHFEEPATGKTWYLEPYDGAENHNIFKIVPAKDQDPLRVQFTNTAGETVVSDKFNVGDAVNQTFAMDIYHGSVGTVIAVLDNGQGQTSRTEVVTVPGTLTVRGTTANVQYGELNKEAEAGKPAVSAPEGTTFTINESNVVASADGVALLFDDIIENTQSESNRKALLEAKVNEVLKDVTVPADKVRAFDMKYLDLVDTQNGNAWVKASNPVTVSWPYPEGTDQNTDFILLHFEELHRDMAANDVANSIANAKVSPVKVTKTATHIEFTTDGFSPFVLVWNTDKPAEPTPPPEPGDNEGDNNNNGNSGNSGNGSNNGGTTSATPAPTAQPAEVKNTAAQPAAAAVIPQTGDESHPMLWVVLLAVSGSLAAVLAYKRRKEER